MKKKTKSNSKKKQLPVWDLSDLYKSPKSPQISKVLSASHKEAKAFAKRYRGKLNKIVASQTRFCTMMQAYEEIIEEALKPLIYAGLLFSESSTDPQTGAFLNKMRASVVGIEKELIFFEIELAAVEKKKLQQLIKAARVQRYANYLKKLLKEKAHKLKENEEKIISDKSLTGKGAFIRLFDEELALKRFKLKVGKKTKDLSEAEVLDLLYHPQVRTRKAAAAAMTLGLKEESRRLSYVFNTLAQDKAIDDRYRNFKAPEDARHLANEIETAVVAQMCTVVQSNYKVVQDFYRFKRRVMGIKKLYDYDRYAPVTKSAQTIPFAKAKTWVLEAFESFSKDYAAIAQLFFDKNWIDAAPRPGKRSGAFCSYVTTDLHPYVFVNYSGTLSEVSTLAHELGHAVHGYLMREQGFLNFSPPLTMAETASVFAEMLLFDHLRKNVLKSKKALFALYVKKIEGIFATVFRQISLYLFEQDFHQAFRASGEQSVEQICTLWRKRQKQMYGSAVELSADYDYWWSYIPHFIHTPFYVYAYAFGELLTLSLYGQYKDKGDAFVEKYMDLLKAGSLRSPQELLKPLGVNLQKESFWKQGISMTQDLVKELKGLDYGR